MTQLTLRGFDPALEKSLRDLAARDNTSLNKAALKLMRRGAGLDTAVSAGSSIGARLRQFGGRMTETEAKSIDRAIEQSREDDLALQK